MYFVDLSKTDNRTRNLSKKSMSVNNHKRNAAMFLIPACRKNTDCLKCEQFYVILNLCRVWNSTLCTEKPLHIAQKWQNGGVKKHFSMLRLISLGHCSIFARD